MRGGTARTHRRGDHRDTLSSRNGEIVAAMIDDEATVKVYRARAGRVDLVPRNSRYPVIAADRAVILGKVVCVLSRT